MPVQPKPKPKPKRTEFFLIAYSRFHGEALGDALVDEGLIRGYELITDPDWILPDTLWIYPRPAPPRYRHVEIRAYARGFGWGEETMRRVLHHSGDPRDFRPRRLYLEHLIAAQRNYQDDPKFLEDYDLRIKQVRELIQADRPAMEQKLEFWQQNGATRERLQCFYDELALPIPE